MFIVIVYLFIFFTIYVQKQEKRNRKRYRGNAHKKSLQAYWVCLKYVLYNTSSFPLTCKPYTLMCKPYTLMCKPDCTLSYFQKQYAIMSLLQLLVLIIFGSCISMDIHGNFYSFWTNLLLDERLSLNINYNWIIQNDRRLRQADKI